MGRFLKFAGGVLGLFFGSGEMVGVVIGDSLFNFLWSDVKGVGNSGRGGHIGYNRFAREEGGYGEAGITDGEFGLGAHFVKLASNNLDVGETIGAIGEGSFATGELSEILVMTVVTIKDNIGWVHIKESSLGGGVLTSGWSVEAGWDKISKSGDVNG